MLDYMNVIVYNCNDIFLKTLSFNGMKEVPIYENDISTKKEIKSKGSWF